MHMLSRWCADFYPIITINIKMNCFWNSYYIILITTINMALLTTIIIILVTMDIFTNNAASHLLYLQKLTSERVENHIFC